MKRNILIGIIIIAVIGVVYFIAEKKVFAPSVTDTKPIQLCFYSENITASGLKDAAWLKMNLSGDKVTGEFRNLPAEKDSKVGTFEGTVGPVDKISMARTADVLWDSMGEGMRVTEQLKIVFGEGNAQAGFGEMVDRGDGVYIYKDPAHLTYGMSMTDVDCNSSVFLPF